MRNLDLAKAFVTAFYGPSVPMSQYQPLSVECVQVAQTIRGDLQSEFKNLTESEISEGVMATLNMLRQLGADTPRAYLGKRNIGHNPQQGLPISAFQAGCGRVRELQAARKIEIQQKEALQSVEERSPVRHAVLSKFDVYYEEAKTEGHPFPALAAWQSLILMDFETLGLESGYAYFLITWQIPQQHNFYDSDECIDTCNRHPRLHNREKTQMRVNGEKWRGKHTS